MSARNFHISTQLSLPSDATTQTIVVYGGKGMGKTNLGTVLAEELSLSHQRFSIIDPMGVFWGLRHSSNGKGDGIEILILGGKHGDIPIEPTGGSVVADLVADERVNVIIDISRRPDGKAWSKAERIRFVADYCTRLMERQAERSNPIMQIIDEAGRYCPQIIPHGSPELARCVGAIEQMVEEGRNFGIGVTLITQRSARMNKSVSELADCMIAFRTIGPNSVDAILDWFGEHVEKARWKELIEKLRALPRGTALVVSPGWLQFEGLAEIRMRTTFDSSATPKKGQERRAGGRGKQVNLERYREKMAETIERVKAEDPKVLRNRIQQLERELKSRPTEQKVVEREKIKTVEKIIRVPEIPREIKAALVKLERQIDALTGVSSFLFDSVKKLKPVETTTVVQLKQTPKFDFKQYGVVARVEKRTGAVDIRNHPEGGPLPKSSDNGDDSGHLKSGALRLLSACAQWYPKWIPASQAASMSKMKARGGSFTNYKSNLVTGGYIEVNGDLWRATDKGLSHTGLGDVGPAPSTTEEVLALWKTKLKLGAMRIIQILIDSGAELSYEQLSEAVGIRGGSFTNYISNLTIAGLVTKPSRGTIAANREALFL